MLIIYNLFGFYFLDYILPWPVWKRVITLASSHLPTYKSVAGTCRLFRRLLRNIPRPRPLIHLNPWVSVYLGLGHSSHTATVRYRQLVDAAGPYSGISLSCSDDVLSGVDIDSTVLTLRQGMFGWYSILDIHTLRNTHHSKCALIAFRSRMYTIH